MNVYPFFIPGSVPFDLICQPAHAQLHQIAITYINKLTQAGTLISLAICRLLLFVLFSLVPSNRATCRGK